MPHDPLKAAFAALREEAHGESDRAEGTLERLLAGSEARKVRQIPRAVKWIPLAAALAVSSAWAAIQHEGVAGTIARLIELEPRPATMGERAPLVRASSSSPAAADPDPGAASAEPRPDAPRAERATEAAAGAAAPQASLLAPGVTRDTSQAPGTPARAAARSLARGASQAEPPAQPPSAEAATTAAAPPAEMEAAPSAGSTNANVTEAADALAADSRDFKAAYRVHSHGSPADSVKAFDRYLAAHPDGRFVPDARYARAIALVRAKRKAEARAALAPFANAPAGSYRREDAARVLQRLDGP